MPKAKSQPKPAQPERPIDKYFNQYAAGHQNKTNKLLCGIFSPSLLLGLMWLAWAIPFPHLAFLGNYNGFFNWASFLIAGLIYFYYQKSPVLSYILLVVLFAVSYGVTGLVTVSQKGGAPLWAISVGVIVVSLIALIIGRGKEQKPSPFVMDVVIAPAWLIQQLFRKTKLRF